MKRGTTCVIEPCDQIESLADAVDHRREKGSPFRSQGAREYKSDLCAGQYWSPHPKLSPAWQYGDYRCDSQPIVEAKIHFRCSEGR
jgi:hypothetical protein